MQDLAAAAQQYAAASAAAPTDFDLVYYHALVLQEMASRYVPDCAHNCQGHTMAERVVLCTANQQHAVPAQKESMVFAILVEFWQGRQ
jgi:hypothetical protein